MFGITRLVLDEGQIKKYVVEPADVYCCDEKIMKVWRVHGKICKINGYNVDVLTD